MGQGKGKGQHAEDRRPDDIAPSDPVADRAADKCAERHGAEKQEQEDLRLLHREIEFLDQVESVIAADARRIEEFGKDEQEQDRNREDDPAARET